MSTKKNTRYFTEEKEEDVKAQIEKPQKRKPLKKTITYNVQVKPRVWGRRHEDRKEFRKNQKSNPKYPGRAPIPEELLKKHSRGEGIDESGIRTSIHKKKLLYKEKNIEFANQQAARNEILLTEESGYIEPDPGEFTHQLSQQDIVKCVDITAATKHFELQLTDFGPYTVKYTRNGRHLLIGGRMGHVAGFDWITKQLYFEINVMESVHDISWLHIETLLAVAQKNWVYIYDNSGVEIHCLKQLYRVTKMEFLPYHFLLSTLNDEGYLSWLDVSIGEIAAQYNTKMGSHQKLAQNPYNACLCLGNSKGVVSMWAPNTREPLAKMLCHKSALTAIHVDPRGMYMATAGTDNLVKVWDIRQLKGPLQIYKMRSAASQLAFSQKDVLAIGTGNLVEIYRDCVTETAQKPYLRYRLNNRIHNLSFCPYEDVLGMGSSKGITSLLVPGCGEPNFDALEANPYQTRTQRTESEVKALLEKIPSDLISMNPHAIGEVDVPTLKDKIEAKKKLMFLKPPKIDYEPRNKMKGKGGSVQIARNKKIVNEEAKKEFIKNMKQVQLTDTDTQSESSKKKKNKKAPYNALDRFLPKK